MRTIKSKNKLTYILVSTKIDKKWKTRAQPDLLLENKAHAIADIYVWNYFVKNIVKLQSGVINKPLLTTSKAASDIDGVWVILRL